MFNYLLYYTYLHLLLHPRNPSCGLVQPSELTAGMNSFNAILRRPCNGWWG